MRHLSSLCNHFTSLEIFFFFSGNGIHQCYIEAICSNNVVGDHGDGTSEMTSSLSTESKRKRERRSMEEAGPERAETRMFHHPV